MEIGAGQGDEVAAILDGRFRDVRVVRDLAGRDRVVVGRRA
jgi:methylase of polypeptide subunit release factors